VELFNKLGKEGRQVVRVYDSVNFQLGYALSQDELDDIEWGYQWSGAWLPSSKTRATRHHAFDHTE
jgi:hypothetical protein